MERNKKPKDILLKVYELDDKNTYDYEIKKHNPKRSLKANATAWSHIETLAKYHNTSKEEMYELMLQRYGTDLKDEDGNSLIISTKSKISSSMDLHVLYIGKGLTNEKEFNHYSLIKGSSDYSSKEFYKFMEGLIWECKEFNLPSIEDYEFKKMMESYKRSKK